MSFSTMQRASSLSSLRPFHRLYSTGVDYNSDEYQFLEKSPIPTYHFQPSLQRLPIPKLDDTLNRYQKALRPILSKENFEAVTKATQRFKDTVAQDLQSSLVAYDKAHKQTSYISEPWFDMYLRSRLPVPVNYNPFMTLAPDPASEYNDQATRATNLCLSIGRLKRALDAEILTPEIFHMNPKKSDTDLFRTVTKTLPSWLSWYGAVAFKAFPLDMSQHPFLFNTTRIPRKDRDEIFRDPGKNHMIVMRQGHFFSVPLFNDNGKLVEPGQLKSSLAHILAAPLKANLEAPASTLTALNRDEWAQQRELIVGTASGKEALEKIDSGLFVLSLDDGPNFNIENPDPVIRSLLYGDGINRWFDKSFSLIVGSDGLSCINFEHAWGDGVAVLRMMEEIHKDANTHHWVSPDFKPTAPPQVQEVPLPLPSSVAALANQRREEYLTENGGLDFAAVQYRRMNRDYVKKHRISPDALMQLAIQMAYYRAYGDSAPTYESCSTSAFRKGRTETMRPATSDTKRAVAAFLGAQRPPANELRSLIKSCSDTHSQLVKEASMGQGFDRHLMGLRVTAQREGIDTGDMFTNPGFVASNQFILSTSTLSTETLVLGGFGPVVPDGFGIGYNIVKDYLGATISAWAKQKNPREFADALEQSLDDLYHVLEHTKEG